MGARRDEPRAPGIRAFARAALAAAIVLSCHRPQPIEPVLLTDTSALDPEVLELVSTHVARVRAAPASARDHGSLGLVYEANGLWDSAAKCFANAEALDRDHALWTYHRAVALKEAGQSVDASRLLRESAAKLADVPGVQHRLGYALLEENDLADARAAFNRALAILPTQPECLVGLAGVEVAEEKWSTARDLCLRALRADSSYKQAHYVLGLAFRGLGMSKEASQGLALGLEANVRYLDDPLSAELKSYRVNFVAQAAEAAQLMSAGQSDKAAALLQRILAKRPADNYTLTNYGAALIELGRLDEAVDVLQRALAIDENEFGTHINLANVYLRAGKPEDALRSADRAVALGPQVGRTHTVRAEVLATRADFAGAYEELKKAVELDARDATVNIALSEVSSRLGRIEEASEWCRKVIEIDPSYLPSRVNLAYFTLQSGDVEQARLQVADLQRIAPNEPRVKELAQRLGLPDAVRPAPVGRPR